MPDPDVKTAMKIWKVIPPDGSVETYEAIIALHSLVWDLWQLRDELSERTS